MPVKGGRAIHNRLLKVVYNEKENERKELSDAQFSRRVY